MKAYGGQGGPKTIPPQSQLKKTPPGNSFKGKIIEYSFWLLEQGYAESTTKGHAKLLRILVKRGANLFDPESMKETIAKQE